MRLLFHISGKTFHKMLKMVREICVQVKESWVIFFSDILWESWLPFWNAGDRSTDKLPNWESKIQDLLAQTEIELSTQMYVPGHG